MKQPAFWSLVWLGVAIVAFLVFAILRLQNEAPNPVSGPELGKVPDEVSETVVEESPELVLPIDEFVSRITKKSFGTYVTPNDSPVQPERFTGFHTAVDVEYDDVTGDVPVRAIADGEVIFSGTIGGYGGVVRQVIEWEGAMYTIVYGHLDSTSTIDVGTVSQGATIGILGDGYTSETANERKHLHFSVQPGRSDDVRGYVGSESALSAWIDPLKFFNL